MCGIAGQISLEGYPIGDLGPHLELMSKLISHKGQMARDCGKT